MAVLRALGADRTWVSVCLHTQVTAIAAVALVVAIPLGVLAGRALFRSYIDAIGPHDDAVVPLALLAAGMAAILLLANLVGTVASRAERRRAPAHVLTGEWRRDDPQVPD